MWNVDNMRHFWWNQFYVFNKYEAQNQATKIKIILETVIWWKSGGYGSAWNTEGEFYMKKIISFK